MNLGGIFNAIDVSTDNNISNCNYVTMYEGRVTEIKNGICYVDKNGANVKCYAKNITNIKVNSIVHIIEKNKSIGLKDRIILEGYSSDSGTISIAWNDITGKPISYAPSAHTHSVSDISDIEDAIPTKTSELTNDSHYITATELNNKGYMTSYTETDPTVPSWAKQLEKPSYTKSEIGLNNVLNEKQYCASNPQVNITGNSATATSSTKATQDESGNNIKSSYASSLSASGSTLTLKSKSGATLSTVTISTQTVGYPTFVSKAKPTTVTANSCFIKLNT